MGRVRELGGGVGLEIVDLNGLFVYRCRRRRGSRNVRGRGEQVGGWWVGAQLAMSQYLFWLMSL